MEFQCWSWMKSGSIKPFFTLLLNPITNHMCRAAETGVYSWTTDCTDGIVLMISQHFFFVLFLHKTNILPCLTTCLTRAHGFHQVWLARQSVMFTQFKKKKKKYYYPQTFLECTTKLCCRVKRKAHGYSCSCHRCDFVGGLDIFVKLWHLKESADNGSFFGTGVSRWCCCGGNLTAAVYDLMAGFRTEQGQLFSKSGSRWIPVLLW